MGEEEIPLDNTDSKRKYLFSTAAALPSIRRICKLLCSYRPSHQHFNNVNTISIILSGKKEIAD